VICKEFDDEELKYRFLFEIFSNFQSTMKLQAIKDFSEIFKIPIADFPDRSIKFEDFVEIIDEYEMNYNEFECCKPMLIAMICLTPVDDN